MNRQCNEQNSDEISERDAHFHEMFYAINRIIQKQRECSTEAFAFKLRQCQSRRIQYGTFQ
jgi:hypothetical protein